VAGRVELLFLEVCAVVPRKGGNKMLFNWADEKIKKFTVFDIGILKLCVISFTLMIAKLWAPILSLEWYVYGTVFIVTYLLLLKKMFG